MEEGGGVFRGFFDAWNADDANDRLALIAATTDESVQFSWGDEVRDGWGGVIAHIVAWQAENPGATAAIERVQRRAENSQFTWSQRVGDADPLVGTGLAQLGSDGRLVWIHVAPGKTRNRVLDGLARWVTANTLAAFTILAGSVFALLYVPMTLFYEKFGLTPRDVGFADYSALWSVLTAAWAVVIVAIAGTVWFLVGLLAPMTLGTRISKRLDGGWRAGCIAALGTLGPIVALFALNKIGFYAFIIGFPLVGLLFVIVIAFLAWREGSSVGRQEFWRFSVELRREWFSSLLVGVLTLLVGGAAILIFQAPTDASDVRTEGKVPFNLLPWKAEPVDVAWRTSNPTVLLPDCSKLRYLGRNGNDLILFDWDTDVTYVVGAADVILQFSSC